MLRPYALLTMIFVLCGFQDDLNDWHDFSISRLTVECLWVSAFYDYMFDVSGCAIGRSIDLLIYRLNLLAGSAIDWIDWLIGRFD